VIQDSSSRTRRTGPRARSARSTSPWSRRRIIAPSEFIGTIMELCQSRRGGAGWDGLPLAGARGAALHHAAWRDHLRLLDSLSPALAVMPASTTKKRRAGRETWSMVDILLQGEPVDAFSAIVHKDSAAAYGNKMDYKAQRAHPTPAVRGGRFRPRSVRGSLRARTSGRSARTCFPSATAARHHA